MTKQVYSVGQVNAYIKNMFARDFMMSRIYVSGEVSNCKYHSSGHIYFTLKDQSGVLPAVMFAGSRKRGLAFPMKAGDKVVVLGEIRVYERDGRYQLYAQEITLQGAGQLYQKFEELKRELEEMGMFSPEYKQPIPRYASRIGVVTAPTGAAIQDIRNISHRRNPFVQLILYPALVQGEGAAASIVNGIRVMEEHDVDVIIVGRGGGSIEDLWAFNEEIVARAVFDCPIPVISAVGHETDTTIIDYVADLRAPTPSAAAELAVFDIRQVFEQLESVRFTLNRRIGERLEAAQAKVRQYELKLRIMDPKNRLMENRQAAADYQDRLQSRMEQILTDRRHRLELFASALDAKSPLKKMQGGFAWMSQADGKRLPGVSALSAGDRIRAYMPDGSFSAVVEEISRAGAEGGKSCQTE
ncbi:MAG: exodeoxyribonuclease VII large subunit [Clostridiales bacterium]|nr:exodeoxyribonuclease VII large subunit [Clostridiales bacterium]